MANKTIKNISPRAIVLCNNGTIKVWGYLIIGTWKNLKPKQTMKEKGFKGTRYLSYVDNLYEAYLLDTTIRNYTRKELKENISAYSRTHDIEIVEEKNV